MAYEGGAGGMVNEGQTKTRRKCVPGFLDAIDQTLMDSGHASLLATSHHVFTWKDPNSEYFLLEQAMNYLKVDGVKKKQVLDRFFKSLNMINLPAGFVVYAQGDKGTNMYLVESGKLQVTIDDTAICTLESGAIFGEMSLLFGFVRKTTITCMEKCVLWSINRTTYSALQKDLSSSSYVKSSKRFLEVPSIASLPNHYLEKLLMQSKKLVCANGQKLCTLEHGLTKIMLIENGFVDCAIPTYVLDMKLPKEELLQYLGVSIDLSLSLDADNDRPVSPCDEDQLNPDEDTSLIEDVKSVANKSPPKVVPSLRKKSRILKKIVRVLRKDSSSTGSHVHNNDINTTTTTATRRSSSYGKDLERIAEEVKEKSHTIKRSMSHRMDLERLAEGGGKNGENKHDSAGDHNIGDALHHTLPPTPPDRGSDDVDKDHPDRKDTTTSASPKNVNLPPLSSPSSITRRHVPTSLSPPLGRTSPTTIIPATLTNALSMETESLLSTTTGNKSTHKPILKPTQYVIPIHSPLSQQLMDHQPSEKRRQVGINVS